MSEIFLNRLRVVLCAGFLHKFDIRSSEIKCDSVQQMERVWVAAESGGTLLGGGVINNTLVFQKVFQNIIYVKYINVNQYVTSSVRFPPAPPKKKKTL